MTESAISLYERDEIRTFIYIQQRKGRKDATLLDIIIQSKPLWTQRQRVWLKLRVIQSAQY